MYCYCSIFVIVLLLSDVDEEGWLVGIEGKWGELVPVEQQSGERRPSADLPLNLSTLGKYTLGKYSLGTYSLGKYSLEIHNLENT